MQLSRIGALWVLAVVSGGCGGNDGADVTGTWSGTATDATGARTLSGNCEQRNGDPTVVRCVFSAMDPARGTSQATLFAHVFSEAGSPNGSLSYALGIVPPPCRINVSGNAEITRTTIEGTYTGSNDCVEGGIHEGRVSLVRP